MKNYRIYGNIQGKRGGAFFGFLSDTGLPAFGGGKLIHAPVWWNTTEEEVQKDCDKIKSRYPDCDCYPKEIS